MVRPTSLTLNGEPRSVSGEPSRSLLFVLRDELGLTGAKPACGEGVCGACTVLADGVAIRLAPAIANAIFAASGRRLRSMPLLPDTPPNGGN